MTSPAAVSDYALPLKPAFFAHFNMERVTELISMEATADGLSVRLRLPLKRVNGSLEIEKQYRSTSIERIPQDHDVPALALWPDFYDEAWGEYEAIMVDAGLKPQTLQFSPLYPHGQTGRAMTLRGDDTDIVVWKSDTPPLGFHIETAGPLSAGIFIRPTVRPPQATGETWDVGIDFGTSNTQIKRRNADGREEALKLSGRAVTLTRASALSADRMTEIHDIEEIVAPFATLLRKETIAVVKGTSVSNEVVGVIPSHPDFYDVARESNEYVRDLKWTADEATQKLYLEQLVRMVAVEAKASGAARLNIHWSYPLSLPVRVRSTMEAFWLAVGNERSRSGFVVQSGAGVTESDALSRYVSARDVLPISSDTLSIAIDVGGGSTDFAFWANDTLIDRVSLNIAGNDVIRLAAALDGMNRRLVALSDPGGGTLTSPTGIADYAKEGFTTRPEIAWNLLLAEAARKQRDDSPHAHPFLTHMSKTNDDQWRKTRTGALLALGGVFFYAGVHAGRHISASTGSVAIYVGGRGSALLAWIAPPARLRELLDTCFASGLNVANPGVSPDVELRGPSLGNSNRAVLKDEVASGLVERGALAAPIHPDLDLTSTPAGEVHWADPAGTEVQWSDLLTAEKLAKVKPPSNHNSSFISYFLNEVVKQSVELYDLDARGLGSLQLSQNWAINDMRRKRDEAILQPIFAYELKSLVRKYVEGATGAQEG